MNRTMAPPSESGLISRPSLRGRTRSGRRGLYLCIPPYPVMGTLVIRRKVGSRAKALGRNSDLKRGASRGHQ